MKPSFSVPSWRARAEALALLCVVILLGALAVLQHRWLGAIAEGERRKLTEEATEKATAIAQDIDRELTRAFLELRIDAQALTITHGTRSLEDFAGRVDRWRAESSSAGLVKAVYIAERSSDGPSRLLRFDESARTLVDEAWPAVLSPVRELLDRADAGPRLPPPLGLSIPPTLPPVMAEVPAILSPVIDVVINARPPAGSTATLPSQIREMFMRHSNRSAVQILLLDSAYLNEKVVAARAVARLGALGPFSWSVVANNGGSVVAGASRDHGGGADAKAPLLRLRFDELDKSLLRGVLPTLPEGASTSSLRLVVSMGSGTAGALHVNRTGGAEAPWTLELRHREGSIDAAVRLQQTRNTLLSASILGVLGVSAGLVFFSARRLRAIATQQVEFVAAVSHELRTPLAVIRSAADNLADGVVQEKDQAKRYGALIRDESVRLTDMVEHVLEFAGADSPARAARGPIDLREAAGAAVEGLTGLAAERGAEVKFEPSSEPLVVSGDMSHLTRALSNLLGNALKYGGDPPKVTVRVARIGTEVVASVADRGAGLEPGDMPRLFEPFYRGQRASEAHIPGSGLGLALVKRIVESHGGRVSAANQAEGGALFTINLPAS